MATLLEWSTERSASLVIHFHWASGVEDGEKLCQEGELTCIRHGTHVEPKTKDTETKDTIQGEGSNKNNG